MARRRSREILNIWPGFVDALGNLLNVLVFVLVIFMMAQFSLGRALTGRNEALARLNDQIDQMAKTLSLERKTTADLKATVARLTDQLGTAHQQLSSAAAAITALSADKAKAEATAADLQTQIAALQALKADLERQITEKDKALAEGNGKLTEQTNIADQARAQVALLNQQLAALQAEVAKLNGALDASDKMNKDQQAQIADLGKQLNRALATKVAELQKYRSEFFGKLREVLGNRPDIRVVGDRFVFQSEVLFPTASAEISPEGRAQIDEVAKTLAAIAKEMPSDIDWVLRVDGHTDKRPINTPQFKSNWELSTARAISVIRALIDDGVPANRLAAAGFGEYQPLVAGDDDASLAKNRRIELKFDPR